MFSSVMLKSLSSRNITLVQITYMNFLSRLNRTSCCGLMWQPQVSLEVSWRNTWWVRTQLDRRSLILTEASSSVGLIWLSIWLLYGAFSWRVTFKTSVKQLSDSKLQIWWTENEEKPHSKNTLFWKVFSDTYYHSRASCLPYTNEKTNINNSTF